MIFAELQKAAEQFADREAIVTPSRRWTYGELHADAAKLTQQWQCLSGWRAGVEVRDVAHLISTLAALEKIGATAVLQRAGRALPGEYFDETGPEYVHIGDAATGDGVKLSMHNTTLTNRPLQPVAGQAILFTSGTSGPPKAAVHDWNSLAAAVRGSEQFRDRRWLLAYDAASFAGLQVILQSLMTGGTLLVPGGHSPDEFVACFQEEHIEMISATPTFWRTLLWSVDEQSLRKSEIRQVTLGGEVADQPLLDALRAALPRVRISHIYASTEMGVCFAVHDGRAGFPAAWLNDESRTCGLRVSEDGELLIRSPRRMAGYADDSSRDFNNDWFPTGDLVRIEGERVLFAGRKSDAIHVGGNKVQPSEVEAVIRSCDDVRDVRVYGIESSLTGQLVAAEVWMRAEADECELRSHILSRCRQQLPKYMTPAHVVFASSTTQRCEKLTRQPAHLHDVG